LNENDSYSIGLSLQSNRQMCVEVEFVYGG
jgi:hypothetical protein